MKKDRDIFSEFQDSLKGFEGNLHVLDTAVPLEKQLAYFRYSENIRNNQEEENLEEQIEILNSADSSFDAIKYAMAFLAISGDVKAYRALENYNKTSNADLNDWASLSLLQAKITLESEFSEEKPVFISTGLGGKANQLRFFAFFKSSNLEPFTTYQRTLIEKEFPFFINKCQGTLEDIKIESNYFTLLFLVTLHVELKKMLEEAVDECNQYGDFINTHFVVTNVKVFNEEDIEKELRKNG